VRALVERLERELEAAEQILAQTDPRLGGRRTIPDRRVSLIDPAACPIRMDGRRRPTEFGYKARVADTGEGFVIADIPERGNPSDDAVLEEPIAKAKQAGMQVRPSTPTSASAPARGDAALVRQRIRYPVIPRRGRASPVEGAPRLEAPLPLRNGLEGRISQLKRKRLRRTRRRSLEGAQTWFGGITLAHNLQRMALLT